MQIYIQKNGLTTGPFTTHQVRTQLEKGTISPGVQIWWEGQAGWQALDQSSVAPQIKSAPPPPAPREELPPAVHQMPSEYRHVPASAKWALGLGILGFVCLPFFAIGAVILGHKARGEIRENLMLKGSGVATAGLILGYLWLAVLLALIPFYGKIAREVQDTYSQMNPPPVSQDTNADSPAAPSQ